MTRVRFRRRGRGVVDGYVGDVLVATLWRVKGGWVAKVYGAPPVAAESFAEARALVRLSKLVVAASAAGYPEPSALELDDQIEGLVSSAASAAPGAPEGSPAVDPLDDPSEWRAFWKR